MNLCCDSSGHYWRYACLPFALAAGLIAGCSDKLESTVSGKVTLDSNSIGPGVVTFAPADGKANPAVGTIQVNGEFFLKTSRTMGLSAGKYRVAVTVHEQPKNARPGERVLTPSKLLTPQKYADVETSGLEFTVEPGRNTIDIPLVSAPGSG